MGKGIDLAGADNPEHAQVMEDFRDQLLVALIRRQADQRGRLVIPVSEIDKTGEVNIAMAVDPVKRVFQFEVQKKQ